MSDLRRMIESTPPGTMFSREGLLRALEDAPAAEGPEFVSTVQAAQLLGYSPKRWRVWCTDGRIEGAWQDDGRWRFPIRAARAYLARRANTKTTKRGRRGPNKAQSTPPGRTRAAVGEARPVLERGHAAVGRVALHRDP